MTVLGHPAGSVPLRRMVGYVTQAPSVYGDLTVRANARYFATVYSADETAAEAAVSDVGLAARADQHADTLSGGELARLSLACALVAAPQLLVLDEPTVGLDPVLRADLWAQFHALIERTATSARTTSGDWPAPQVGTRDDRPDAGGTNTSRMHRGHRTARFRTVSAELPIVEIGEGWCRAGQCGWIVRGVAAARCGRGSSRRYPRAGLRAGHDATAA